MTDVKLYSKLSSLPKHLKEEVADFIDFLDSKKRKSKLRKKKRVFGYAKGAIFISHDFDEPLDEFKEYM